MKKKKQILIIVTLFLMANFLIACKSVDYTLNEKKESTKVMEEQNHIKENNETDENVIVSNIEEELEVTEDEVFWEVVGNYEEAQEDYKNEELPKQEIYQLVYNDGKKDNLVYEIPLKASIGLRFFRTWKGNVVYKGKNGIFFYDVKNNEKREISFTYIHDGKEFKYDLVNFTGGEICGDYLLVGFGEWPRGSMVYSVNLNDSELVPKKQGMKNSVKYLKYDNECYVQNKIGHEVESWSDFYRVTDGLINDSTVLYKSVSEDKYRRPTLYSEFAGFWQNNLILYQYHKDKDVYKIIAINLDNPEQVQVLFNDAETLKGAKYFSINEETNRLVLLGTDFIVYDLLSQKIVFEQEITKSYRISQFSTDGSRLIIFSNSNVLFFDMIDNQIIYESDQTHNVRNAWFVYEDSKILFLSKDYLSFFDFTTNHISELIPAEAFSLGVDLYERNNDNIIIGNYQEYYNISLTDGSIQKKKFNQEEIYTKKYITSFDLSSDFKVIKKEE